MKKDYIISNSNEIINNSNFNDMINEEALVATPNAAENNNAVATASVEQVNNTKTTRQGRHFLV